MTTERSTISLPKVEGAKTTREGAVHSLGYRLRKWGTLAVDYLVLIALALFFLFPIVFMLVSSFKNNETQVIRDMSSIYAFIPRGEIGFQNYRDVFAEMPFGRFLFNSTLIVGTIVLFGVFVNSLAAYALARLNFPWPCAARFGRCRPHDHSL